MVIGELDSGVVCVTVDVGGAGFVVGVLPVLVVGVVSWVVGAFVTSGGCSNSWSCTTVSSTTSLSWIISGSSLKDFSSGTEGVDISVSGILPDDFRLSSVDVLIRPDFLFRRLESCLP